MVKILTLKQEKYVLNLINGMSQREAYKNAYNAKNMKDETIDKRASELFQKGEIKGRYNELLEETKNKAIMSARDRQIWLSKVVNGEIKEKCTLFDDGDSYDILKEVDVNTKIKALDTLNKMTGEYIGRVMNITPPTIEDDIL